MPIFKLNEYPKPGRNGGALIRSVIQFLRSQNVSLPISTHILIAVSGGSDSVGLAHLLLKYGRRIIPREQISLVHINHGWRAEVSDEDEKFVRDLAKSWNVPIHVSKFECPKGTHSWEDEARKQRKKVFSQLAKKLNAFVLTAHHADDFAETVLWRICTGSAETHAGGVLFREGKEIRPFLKTRKEMIRKFLAEEQVLFKEDSTNFSNRFLRSKIRSALMPEINALFPKAVDHLVSLGLKAQGDCTKESEGVNQSVPCETLFGAAGIRAKRSHFEAILEKAVAKKDWYGEIHLPGGWRLIREKRNAASLVQPGKLSSRYKRENSFQYPDRWILERI